MNRLVFYQHGVALPVLDRIPTRSRPYISCNLSRQTVAQLLPASPRPHKLRSPTQARRLPSKMAVRGTTHLDLKCVMRTALILTLWIGSTGEAWRDCVQGPWLQGTACTTDCTPCMQLHWQTVQSISTYILAPSKYTRSSDLVLTFMHAGRVSELVSARQIKLKVSNFSMKLFLII